MQLDDLSRFQLYQKLDHLEVVFEDSSVDGQPASFILRQGVVLIESLMLEPILASVEQVAHDFEAVIDGSDVQHVLTLLVLLLQVQFLAAHQHFSERYARGTRKTR